MTYPKRFWGLVGLVLFLAPCQNSGLIFPGTTASAGAGGDAAASAAHRPRLLENLGSHTHEISTNSELAQKYFNQGLILTYGFNHEAAIDAFREAARHDPDCAMCYWGEAFAWGPNINAPMGPEAAKAAYAALQKAQSLASKADDRDRAYIEALSARYSADSAADRKKLDLAFAVAMQKLHKARPDDNDAATLYAEALLDLNPWDYWTDDGQPREHTQALVAILEAVLERDPQHPGANHYLIHALEEFEPERAEAAADRLATVAPDAGHLVHMPSHIYWRVGRYEDAININELAAAADVAYFAWCRSPEAYAAGYYNHNLHFIWSASSAEGRRDRALTAARRLVGNIPPSAVKTYPFLEDFLVVPMLTQARFGQWDAVLGEPRPPADWVYTTAVWHYVRGLAYTRKGELEAAEIELAGLTPIATSEAMAANIFDVAGNSAGQRLTVGLHHLRGELAAAQGQKDAAIASLEAAVKFQDSINYIEPPAWYMPSRQALGALLLDAGKAAEAEQVYRIDLIQYPKNGWSLYGLARSLEAQGKKSDARYAMEGHRNAWARSDVKLTASRF